MLLRALRFLGRNLLLVVILLQLMIPSGVLLVQNFRMINLLGLFDTRLALMLPYWGSGIWHAAAAAGIPRSADRAGRSGANRWREPVASHPPCLCRQCHPRLCRLCAGLAQLALERVSLAPSSSRAPKRFVRSLSGLNKLIKTTDQGAFYGQLMAGTIIVITPLVILFLLFQRQFVESFARSGIR